MQCSTVDADSSPEANDQYVMGPLLASTVNYEPISGISNGCVLEALPLQYARNERHREGGYPVPRNCTEYIVRSRYIIFVTIRTYDRKLYCAVLIRQKGPPNRVFRLANQRAGIGAWQRAGVWFVDACLASAVERMRLIIYSGFCVEVFRAQTWCYAC